MSGKGVELKVSIPGKGSAQVSDRLYLCALFTIFTEVG